MDTKFIRLLFQFVLEWNENKFPKSLQEFSNLCKIEMKKPIIYVSKIKLY